MRGEWEFLQQGGAWRKGEYGNGVDREPKAASKVTSQRTSNSKGQRNFVDHNKDQTKEETGGLKSGEREALMSRSIYNVHVTSPSWDYGYALTRALCHIIIAVR